jgi:hypothetical protein
MVFYCVFQNLIYSRTFLRKHKELSDFRENEKRKFSFQHIVDQKRTKEENRRMVSCILEWFRISEKAGRLG